MYTLEHYFAKMKLESDNYFWTMSPEQYAKVEITNVEEDLTSNGNRLPSKCVTPLLSNYVSWPEDSPELMVDGM